MKDIKFRAWDKDNGIMYYSDKEEDNGEKPIWWEIDTDGIQFGEMEFDQWYDPDDKQMHENIPGQELMQYTGLKDKNDVEIYEGDIIKIGDDIDTEEIRDIRKLAHLDGYIGRGIYVEVIGNIYEDKK